MNIRALVISGIICSGIFLGFNLLWHLVIFSGAYSQAHHAIARPHVRYTILVISCIFKGFLFSIAYAFLVKKHSSIFRGFFFGLLVGLLLSSSSGIYYAAYNFAAIDWLWLEFIGLLISSVVAGLAIPLICWRSSRKNPENS